jgi:16S rRNA (cytosine967-C5)-methyltransferase
MGSAGLAARGLALDWLEAVLDRRRPLDEATAAAPPPEAMPPSDRAFARLLALTVLRRLGQIDALVGRCLERPLPARAASAQGLLRLGAAQLLFLGTPPHAAVDTTVRLAAARGAGPYRRLVNAVLRRLAREGAGWREGQDAARLNTPNWLWRSWSAAYGEERARAIGEAHLGEPPLDITAKHDPANLAARLDAELLPTGTLRRPAGGRIEDLPGYDEGLWWVQDAAAALPARLLGAVAGETVVELCAAPGGKTAQLAAAGARVIAVDRARARLGLLERNLSRLGLAADVVEADATRWRPPRPVRFVLLDAPCVATGTIRRHPDVARIRRREHVAHAAARQARLVENAAAMLAPGGTLVYAVCSLEPEEGPRRIEALLAAGAPLTRAPVVAGEVGGMEELVTARGELRCLPCHLAGLGGLDGFYVARLKRKS